MPGMPVSDNKPPLVFTGSSPSISIYAGLEKTIAWFREHVRLDNRTMTSLEVNTWSRDPAEAWLAKLNVQHKVA